MKKSIQEFNKISLKSKKTLNPKDLQDLALKENARLLKWNKMLLNFEDYKKKNFNKLKSRTRKGIPDCLRGLIWQNYADIDEYRLSEDKAGLYDKLINDENTDIELESVILRDIDRTFPKHSFFKDKYGLG